MRICKGLKKPNEIVKEEHFHLPSQSRTMGEVAGVLRFSKAGVAAGTSDWIRFQNPSIAGTTAGVVLGDTVEHSVSSTGQYTKEKGRQINTAQSGC